MFGKYCWRGIKDKKMPDDKKIRSSAGWRLEKPQTAAERRVMKTDCFLVPESRKYPVCPMKSNKPSCKGLLAAAQRARLNISRNAGGVDHHAVLKKAMRLAGRENCEWSQSSSSSSGYRKLFEKHLRR